MSEINSASFPLYNPRGIRVHFTVPFDDDGSDINATIDMLLANGYMVNAVGLEANEKRETIGWVVRYNHTNKKDGSVTPRIFFYSDNDKLVNKVGDTYLNTGEETVEFERVTGLQVSKLPVWVARGAPERTDAGAREFVTPVAKPFAIVNKPNPDYKGEGDLEHTKYLFVRYEPVATTPPPTETRYRAIIDLNNRPTGAQPQPSANPTPPQPSPTERTEQVSGASREPKVINGSDPASFDEVFGKRLERVTPDALFATSANLFNARAHFDNWWNKHEGELDKMTLTDAVTFVGNERWSRDKERVKLLVQFGERVGLQHTEVLDALSTAAGKKLDAFSKWDHGNFAYAHAAVMAYHAGFNGVHANQLLNEGVLPKDMYQQVLEMCVKYSEETA